jgi:hypothetical protein
MPNIGCSERLTRERFAQFASADFLSADESGYANVKASGAG